MQLTRHQKSDARENEVKLEDCLRILAHYFPA